MPGMRLKSVISLVSVARIARVSITSVPGTIWKSFNPIVSVVRIARLNSVPGKRLKSCMCQCTGLGLIIWLIESLPVLVFEKYCLVTVFLPPWTLQICKRRLKVLTSSSKSPAVTSNKKSYKHVEMISMSSIKRVVDVEEDEGNETCL